MYAKQTLTFVVEPLDDPPTSSVGLVPVIDGVSLIALIDDHERARGYQPAGGYFGIVPRHFRCGDLREYFLGREARQWPRPGHAWVLGCGCGDVGCWPLSVQIDVTDEGVCWSHFEQPHRPDWDYSDFGPFRFTRADDDRAVHSVWRTDRGSGGTP